MPSPHLPSLSQAHYSLHQAQSNPIYHDQGVAIPAAAAGQHREDEGKMHHDASPHAFSPPHPQFRSWYSEDSSYTQESLRQLQLDAAARGEVKGSKRMLTPSESLPPNFESMKRQSEESDEERLVTREIREKAGEIIEETSGNRVIKTDLQKPLDPNLVCPYCGIQFCVFEIQEFRRHAIECGTKVPFMSSKNN